LSYEEWTRKKEMERRLRERLIFEAKRELLDDIMKER
jgi:hypothetical protein